MTYLHCLQHSLFEHLFNLYLKREENPVHGYMINFKRVGVAFTILIGSLTNKKSPDLAQAMNDLSATCNVTLQWIPAHCGITGNEEADHLAKLGAQSEQPDVQVSYKEKVTIIKAQKSQDKTLMHIILWTGQSKW